MCQCWKYYSIMKCLIYAHSFILTPLIMVSDYPAPKKLPLLFFLHSLHRIFTLFLYLKSLRIELQVINFVLEIGLSAT